jgi:uncharacterized cupin superfamily protein
MTVAHCDDVEFRPRAKGEMDASWQRLGDAAGTRGVGVNRVRVAPRRLPTPPHSHGASEEIYFVLAGSGLAWQDGHVHEVRPLDCIVHRADEHEHTFVGGVDGLTPLATSERSRRAGLHWERLAPGRRGSVPHCHSAEEEVFVILEGTATLELWPRPSREAAGDPKEEVPIRAGHVVARPPGTGVAHSFRAGPEGVTMLIYGTREPNDIAWYPRSRKLYWRGVGVIGRIETLDYVDGEPVEDD